MDAMASVSVLTTTLTTKSTPVDITYPTGCLFNGFVIPIRDTSGSCGPVHVICVGKLQRLDSVRLQHSAYCNMDPYLPYPPDDVWATLLLQLQFDKVGIPINLVLSHPAAVAAT